MTTSTPDVLLILGKGVSPTGAIPAIVQTELNQGIQLSRQSNSTILCTGKYSGLLNRPPSKCSEAEAMRDYAIRRGTDPSRVLTENQARDTIGNAIFSKTIIDQHHWKNVLVFCTEFHYPRAKFVFDTIYNHNYTVNFYITKQEVTWREYWHLRRYEFAATLHAHWLLAHLPNTSPAEQERWIHAHHFMYNGSWLRKLAAKLFQRPVHRQPKR